MEIGCSMMKQTIQKDIRYLKEYKSVKEITIPKVYYWHFLEYH
jgi:hypothetical protein